MYIRTFTQLLKHIIPFTYCHYVVFASPCEFIGGLRYAWYPYLPLI